MAKIGKTSRFSLKSITKNHRAFRMPASAECNGPDGAFSIHHRPSCIAGSDAQDVFSDFEDRKILTIPPDDSEHSCSFECSVPPKFQALLLDDPSMVAEVAAGIIRIDSDAGQ